MSFRRESAHQKKSPGVIVTHAKAELLRDIGPSVSGPYDSIDYCPTPDARLYPNFGPGLVWERDEDYRESADASDCDVFPIVSHTTGLDSTITVASTNADIFKKYDPLVVRGSGDEKNDKRGRCIADAVISGGQMVVSTNLNMEEVDVLGEILRIVPPPRRIGEPILIVNRSPVQSYFAGDIVDVEQESGSEWWSIVAGGGGSLGNEWIEFSVYQLCPGVPDQAIQAVWAQVTGTSCQSSFEIGQIVLIYDRRQCVFNIPIEQLANAKGTADLMAGNNEQILFCAEWRSLGACYLQVRSLCCTQDGGDY